MNCSTGYFVETYEESRVDFRALLDQVCRLWPSAELVSYPVEVGSEDLSIDLIKARPLKSKKRLIALSTALHGIEGYVGAAVVKMFVAEYLRHLNPDDTGLYLVHAINPWGMKYRRRVNENNVDLNRNFIYESKPAVRDLNLAYERVNSFLNPRSPLQSAVNPIFYLKLLALLLSMGFADFRSAVLYGQYRHPRGLYYGGTGFERSAAVLSSLFQEIASSSERFLLIDMHSGYGPRYQMTIVNSIYEPRDSAGLQVSFNYPLVAKTDPGEFYQMQGDMVDYLYQVMQDQFPGKDFYATSFEFGTLGSSTSALIKSLRAMVNENRATMQGSASGKVAARAKYDFCELFFPGEARWREKALHDARLALSGIMKAEKFVD